MTGNAEFLIVRRFHKCIETAPEYDARDYAQYKNCEHRMLRVWLNKETPGAFQDACITNYQKSLRKKISNCLIYPKEHSYPNIYMALPLIHGP
jgi:hypothetical protein